jgi:DNA-binding NarL/FixJ family response regulator
MTIRVAFADDHPVVLAGIAALLGAAPEITVVGSARTGRDALDMIQETRPDVAVIDLSMPDFSGFELARRLAECCPGVKVLALTVHEDRAYVQSFLQAGAQGYLLKRSAAEDLLGAILAVASGGLYLDPVVAQHALPTAGHSTGSAAARNQGEQLSPREYTVLRLIAQGFSNKEIASRIEVSAKTVETYKSRAAEKLGLRTRAQIVRYATSRGWLDDVEEPSYDVGPPPFNIARKSCQSLR